MTNQTRESAPSYPTRLTSRVAIIDTNILVSGLITSVSDSPVVRIVDDMLSSAFSFVVSQHLVAEYRNVLVRPNLIRLHKRSAQEIEAILVALLRSAIMLESGRGPKAPDPDDQFLWDLLSTRADLVLVTGDKLLLSASNMTGRVLTAREWCAE